MSDTTQDLQIQMPDASFGRKAVRVRDGATEVGLPRGWWLLPMMAGGIACWGMLLRMLFF